MKFVADESLEAEILRAARTAGHVVFAITEEAPSVSDTEVLRNAFERGEPIVTNDKDFGEKIFFEGLDAVGIILLRLTNMTPDERARRLVDWLETNAERVPGSFVVIGNDNVRVRALPELP